MRPHQDATAGRHCVKVGSGHRERGAPIEPVRNRPHESELQEARELVWNRGVESYSAALQRLRDFLLDIVEPINCETRCPAALPIVAVRKARLARTKHVRNRSGGVDDRARAGLREGDALHQSCPPNASPVLTDSLIPP